VDAALAENAPASAKAAATSTERTDIFVLGKLTAAGGPQSWKLKDAVILDLAGVR
jgi:hypothetical protein